MYDAAKSVYKDLEVVLPSAPSSRRCGGSSPSRYNFLKRVHKDGVYPS